jgi:uncharacterized Zn ribbon protein
MTLKKRYGCKKIRLTYDGKEVDCKVEGSSLVFFKENLVPIFIKR